MKYFPSKSIIWSYTVFSYLLHSSIISYHAGKYFKRSKALRYFLRLGNGISNRDLFFNFTFIMYAFK